MLENSTTGLEQVTKWQEEEIDPSDETVKR